MLYSVHRINEHILKNIDIYNSTIAYINYIESVIS